MATKNVKGKWNKAEEEEDEEEEEALSLCDLPINLEAQPRNQEHKHVNEATQEEFNFRSWSGFFSKEPEMCVADEVFFKGQILPMRLSFSTEAGLLTTGSQHYAKRFINESLDHASLGDFQSNNSSRSSSVRSQNSSSSTSSTTTTTTTTTTAAPPPRFKPSVRNQFHTHPSPKPQLRVSAPRQLVNQGRKSSSAWEIFRLGVVPAPEIGLQDLKVRSSNSANRNCVSRNSSSSSNNSASNSNAKSVKTSNDGNKSNHVLKQLIGKGGGLLSGCDCSFETVQSNMVMIKGGKSTNKAESTTHAVKEKVVELKKQKQRQKQGKKVMSRRRTFEWLKELHASHDPDDEKALLSKPS